MSQIKCNEYQPEKLATDDVNNKFDIVPVLRIRRYSDQKISQKWNISDQKKQVIRKGVILIRKLILFICLFWSENFLF